VALVKTDVSKESIASIIRVTRIGELRTLAVTRPETHAATVLTRATLRNIPEEAFSIKNLLCNLDRCFSKSSSSASMADTRAATSGGTKSNNYLLIREHIPLTN
jgi:hypothetical protein